MFGIHVVGNLARPCEVPSMAFDHRVTFVVCHE